MRIGQFGERLSCALIVAASLAGCATPPPPAPAPAVDPVAERLKAAIVKVDALPARTNGADEKAPAPKVGNTVTISYQGDASELLKRVAAAMGKEQPKVRGPKPYLPLIVHVDVVNVSYEEFLKDVGHQFGQRADLVLADEGVLEIRYRGHP